MDTVCKGNGKMHALVSMSAGIATFSEGSVKAEWTADSRTSSSIEEGTQGGSGQTQGGYGKLDTEVLSAEGHQGESAPV